MGRRRQLLAMLGSAVLVACQSAATSAPRQATSPTDRPVSARSAPAPAGTAAGEAESASETVRGATGGTPSASGEVLAQVAVLDLPHGAPGIGFDDLRFSPGLDRVLAPAGRSGRLDLVDPRSRAVLDIQGFSESAAYSGGHDDGVTSADSGPGVLYATDRTTQRLAVVDAASRTIVEWVALAAHPDYVRYVEPTREVWVTQPDADQLEVFSVDESGRHPAHQASIAVRGGPESLVVDPGRSRVYTHLWRGATVAVDIHTRAIVAHWDNGCRSSRGIALDEEHGLLIAACAEGKAVVLDVRDGRRISEIETGGGVDIIDFDPRARHVYVPSGASGTMVVAALSGEGRLTAVGSVPTTRGAHCVAADRRGNAYVCDPARGRLQVVHDGVAER